MRPSARARRAVPFYVMEIAKAADELVRRASPADPSMIYLNIGEPDFRAPPGVREAAEQALRRGDIRYTPAAGLPELRQCLSDWYGRHFGLQVPASRILVTSGASAALQLACLALVEAGDEVLMPDPCYPCNRHFVTAAGGQARLLPCGPEQRFQLDAAGVEAAWTPTTRGVVLASPSNPTGTSIDPAEMRRIVEAVRARGGVTVVDEIYLGLSYDQRYGSSALVHGEHGDDVISVNSFSKYFSMTGWRLGWVVLPPALVPAVEKLAQNLYICASSLAQHAALACFEPAAIAEYERRRGEFQRRRDVVLDGLDRIGLKVPVAPDGAFYAWADCSAFSPSSWDFCHGLLHSAHVALTPGRDFGPAAAERYLRLSYASSMAHLQEALTRLQRVLHA